MQLKISEIAEIILGHTFRSAVVEEEGGNYAVLQAKNINSDGSLKKDFPRVSLEKIRSQGLVQSKDIILTNRGSFRTCFYEGTPENLIAASSVYLLRTKDDRVKPEFLALFLNSKRGQFLLEKCGRGATIRSLPRSSLENIEIPVPTTEQQDLMIKINQNHQERSRLYKKRTQLQQQIAEASINKILTA